MNLWMYAQLVLYEFFDVIPFVVLAVAPYRKQIKTSKTILLFTVVLYVLGFARRSLSYIYPGVSVFFSILWIFLYIAVYFYVIRAAPLLTARENDKIWAFLWFVPATFCVFFYYSLYTKGSILAYSNSTHNLIFSLVISAGSFFVLSLMLRLVRDSSLATRLMSERHQLELRALQYRSLSERIEEARLSLS